ncbi:MAG: FtsX-like permease family protein [Cytophagales bacterium]|nr:FtsX-like permease family protein [Cytophagales bacterium]
MFKLYLLTSLRTLRKSKTTTAIIIFSMTVALMFLLLVLTFAQSESSFDNFHSKSNRIGRVISHFNDTDQYLAATPYRWMPALLNQVPEVKHSTSFLRFTPSFRKGQIMINEPNGLGVEPSFFEVFDFPVISGNKDNFLHSINGIVLTEKMAHKYFGTIEVLGKTMSSFDDEGNPVEYIIEGIVQCPVNSHIQFDYLLPFEISKISYRIRSERLGLPNRFLSWNTHFCSNYLLIEEGSNFEAVSKKLSEIINENISVSQQNRFSPFIQGLEDIYLKSDFTNDFAPRGSYTLLTVLITTALILLILALINFTNLTIALSLERVKEIGIKKTMGNSTRGLLTQFTMEAAIVLTISAALAYGLIFGLSTQFNEFVGKPIDTRLMMDFENVSFSILIISLLSILTAIYPTIKLSRIKPAQVLYSGSSYRLESGRSKYYLVGFQICISAVFFVSTIIVFMQINHISEIDLGFNKHHKIVVTHWGIGESDFELRRLRRHLQQIPAIESVSASNNLPGLGRSYSGSFSIPTHHEELTLSIFHADMQILNALDLELVHGRGFDGNIRTDSSMAYVINQAAMNLFSQYNETWGMNPIGRSLTRVFPNEQRPGKIIGVVKDFHFDSFQNEIEPLVICITSLGRSRVIIKVNTANEELLSDIQAVWSKLYPDSAVNYRFLEDQFDAYLSNEKVSARLILTLGLFIVFISCLGIIGLILFVVKSKQKEIGIRKVIGASFPSLLLLMSKRYLLLAAMSSWLAYPISYILMNSWLGQFAYRISMPFQVYLLSTIISILLVAMIILWMTQSTLKRTPAEMLKT